MEPNPDRVRLRRKNYSLQLVRPIQHDIKNLTDDRVDIRHGFEMPDCSPHIIGCVLYMVTKIDDSKWRKYGKSQVKIFFVDGIINGEKQQQPHQILSRTVEVCMKSNVRELQRNKRNYSMFGRMPRTTAHDITRTPIYLYISFPYRSALNSNNGSSSGTNNSFGQESLQVL